MVSRNYDENDHRRSPQFARNESSYGGPGGRDEGEEVYPPRNYGRDFYPQQERYPQRADYGYRDSDRQGRSGSGDAFRGNEGQGSHGYVGERGDQGYFEEGHGGRRGEYRAHEQPTHGGSYGLRSDFGGREQYQYGGGAEEGRERTRQFDADYHQWRKEQLSELDDDYQAWRGERYKKFADEFSRWRSGRSSPGEESKGRGSEKETAGKNK